MNLRRLAVLAVLVLAVAVTPAAAQPASDDAETVDTVLLASTANYPDALVAGAAANKIGVPVLLTDQGQLTQETRDALSRLDPSEVVAVGGPAVISDQVIATLESDYNVTRLWGTTRYGTAAEVAEHFWIEGSESAVLVQNSFQDRNGSVLAVAKELGREEDDPVYLTPEGSVPAVVLNSLRALGVQEVTVVGRTVTDAYRSSLTELGISIDEEITAETDQAVRERVQDRVTQRLNGTTDLLVVASSGYRQSIAAANLPATVSYHVTSEDDLAELVQAVNDRNVSTVKVAGQPDLAEEAAERLRDETGADVHLVVARAAEAIRMNTNLTNDNVPAFAREHRRKAQEWEEHRERLQEHVQLRANHSLTRAENLVDENASEEAQEALHEAQVLYSNGSYVESHEAAMDAISEVRAERYHEARDDAGRLQERINEEVQDLQERVDDLQELNREFAEEMRQNLTAEERLEIIEDFRDERRERIRELMEEARKTRGDLHERLREARHELETRSTVGRFEVELGCADEDVRTAFDITGHAGYLEAEGTVSLNTPNYRPVQETTIDRNGSSVDIAIAFHQRDGFGVQCTGMAEVERRVRVAPGNWTVDLTVTVAGEEVHTGSATVTVTADDDTGDDESGNETEDETEHDETEDRTDDRNGSDDQVATVPSSFRLESTDGTGGTPEAFYYDGSAVEEIAVRAGTQYTVTFAPRRGGTYSAGAQFYSDPESVFGSSDVVQGGETTTVTFNATDDFDIIQYWPDRRVRKGDIDIDVR